MFQTVSTNAAGILTIILMWSTLVWAVTYMYMSEKIRREKQAFEGEFGHVLDDYTDHYYEPMFDIGAEYEIQDNGSWKRVN